MIDQPLIRGIILAFFFIAISASGFVAFFVGGFLIQMVFTAVPGLVVSILPVLAITTVLIRAVIRKIVIGSRNQVLALGIGVSPLVLLALAGLVRWLVFSTAYIDGDMGDVVPAFVGITMTVYSLVVLFLGMWEIRAGNQ